MSSLARGATTTPPRMTPVPGLLNSFTKPSLTPAILARGLVASGCFSTRAATSPAVTARCETPTVAISGSVEVVAATWPSRSGPTASPSVCHIAIRPCIAATEASISTPVQSPAAYTAVGQRDRDGVAIAADGLGPGPGQDGHAAAAEDVLDQAGRVLVFLREHPVPRGHQRDA